MSNRVISYHNVVVAFFQFVCLSVFTCSHVFAFDINKFLESEEPEGVVFDIVSGDATLLKTLLPEVQGAIKKIREKYPSMEIAIVTHGDEQFGLLENNKTKLPSIHNEVKDLVISQDVNVHVCGTYAGWHNYTDEDFPEYVDVTAAGPAQVNDYRALGFTVIKLP